MPGSSPAARETTALSTFAVPGGSWASSSRWSSPRLWRIRCAARSALRRRPLKPSPLELVLTPVDNQRLANLCGTLDENLRQIETALDVTIARRGERFTVRGAHAAQAADVLLKFYDDAKRGLTLDDIQLGLIEVRSRGRAKEETPLLTRRAYMRGRTLNHSFVILDEAQNTTPEQMKMFLTRIGFGSKAVVTGDITQIDLARGQKSGMVAVQKILADVRGIAFTAFKSDDVVRHPLVQRIVDAYERHADD